MKDWFTSLESREQIFVSTAAVLIALAIFWLAVWEPLDSGQKAAAERVDTWKQSLAALRPMKNQVQQSAAGRPAVTGQDQSLVVIVDNSLRHPEPEFVSSLKAPPSTI